MKPDKLLIIPQKDKLEDYMRLAEEYNCGFEYNDFFLPAVLENQQLLKECISLYNRSENRPLFSTMHGAFLDVSIFSDDPRIREVSDYRVTQSLQIATELNAQAVIFHTNFVPNFRLKSYMDNWVETNVKYWTKKLEEFPTLSIYVENMFDEDCELLARLGERMCANERFGICFDYAHAHVFGDEADISLWVERLAPYVKHIHINDNDFLEDSHLALGDGSIDWESFKRYYEKYFDGASVLLEVSGLEKTGKSLEFISSL